MFIIHKNCLIFSGYFLFLFTVTILVSQSFSISGGHILARQQTSMQSLSAPFTIEVNGKPICSIDTNAEDYTQAKVGTDAATFTLKDGRLQSGEWFLGRNLTEDRSMLPKKVFWFKAGPEIENRVQIVTASRNGESYQLKFAGMYSPELLCRRALS
jgi:hypothetical protein